MPGLSHSHSIDSGHQHKGHDQLPQEQLSRGNGDSSLMREATRHAVPAAHMHRGNQDCLQAMTQHWYALAASYMTGHERSAVLLILTAGCSGIS